MFGRYLTYILRVSNPSGLDRDARNGWLTGSPVPDTGPDTATALFSSLPVAAPRQEKIRITILEPKQVDPRRVEARNNFFSVLLITCRFSILKKALIHPVVDNLRSHGQSSRVQRPIGSKDSESGPVDLQKTPLPLFSRLISVLADVDTLAGDGYAFFGGLIGTITEGLQRHRNDSQQAKYSMVDDRQMTKTCLVPGSLCQEQRLLFQPDSRCQSLTGWRPHLRDWPRRGELTLLRHRRLSCEGGAGEVSRSSSVPD